MKVKILTGEVVWGVLPTILAMSGKIGIFFVKIQLSDYFLFFVFLFTKKKKKIMYFDVWIIIL